jgi:hypothetical protein
MYHHVKKLMYTVSVGEPDPRFGKMLLEQFGGANGELAAAMQYSIQGLNCDDSTGEGDTGEKDLLGPWNDNASVERVDAPAFQEFADSKKGTRTATPISGPELDAPVNEAPQPAQKDPSRAEVKKNGKRSAKYA